MLIDLFTKLENVHEARIKRIRSDNGTEFKNRILDLYCLRKGIEHQYSAPYTPQQNGVAERKNRTLIEAATMLSDSKLPVLFWGEAVNTACYVLNKVLTVKRFNKTCHELMFNEKPNLTGFEPFGLPCTIVRNKDKQKFGEVADEGYFLGYVPGTPNKRVFSLKTGKIEVVFNVEITSYKPQQSTSGPAILYDYESVFKSFNIPEVSDADDSQLIQTVIGEDDEGEFMPRSNVDMSDAPETSHGAADPDSSDSEPEPNQGEDFINPFANQNIQGEVGSNLGDNLEVDAVATTRANRDHPVDMILGDPTAGVQTRRSIAANSGLFVSIEKTGIVNECLYSCFISQEEPKNIHMALKDNSWVEAMQEELAQFAKLKVWELVDLPKGEREIGTKWVFRCKKDERGIVTRNKARLVVKGFNQQEGIDYNEVFALVARLEAIRLFLAFASFKGFKVYQLDVKSAFLYGKVQELVYVSQPEGFVDPDYPDRVYKLDKALYGLHQPPRAWYETLSTHLLKNGFERGQIDSTLFIKRKKEDFLLVQVYVDDIIFGSSDENMCKEFEQVMKSKFEMSAMGELSYFLGLQVEQKEDGMFIHQTKYVYDILDRFKMNDCTTCNTPICENHNLGPDHESTEDVDPTHYRAMIGSLMYLTASRPDIMFAVCLCARYQANPKESHMKAVKRILRYLKGKPKLGLWYPTDSDLRFVAYTDSDFGGCKSNRKSTTGGCQFLGGRIVSWQCKKQSCVSTSTCEAEYIAAGSCCSQVLWIQQQMRDYGLDFTRTPIMIDNNATISITNNPVKHSRTKHIDIRHHFIRDCAEKRLIELHRVDTEDNLADLYTKAFDRARFEHLVELNGMRNPE
ncbi:putative RNA-directed DNA polymerase [Helianthus annuus]|nr:putative RNA-directed DNA polymerase [Helianthus annuus]